MNKYELALVLSSKLADEAKQAEFNKVTELLTRFGATIDKVDDWGKRRLAYEIKKETEGFYSFITFDAEPTVPVEIESRIRIMEGVLRYLIVRKDG